MPNNSLYFDSHVCLQSGTVAQLRQRTLATEAPDPSRNQEEKHCNISVNTYSRLSADLTFNCSAAGECHEGRANRYVRLIF